MVDSSMKIYNIKNIVAALLSFSRVPRAYSFSSFIPGKTLGRMSPNPTPKSVLFSQPMPHDAINDSGNNLNTKFREAISNCCRCVRMKKNPEILLRLLAQGVDTTHLSACEINDVCLLLNGLDNNRVNLNLIIKILALQENNDLVIDSSIMFSLSKLRDDFNSDDKFKFL